MEEKKISFLQSILDDLRKMSLSQDAERFYGTIFKSLGIIGAIVAFFWGIYEFKVDKEREYRKEIFLEQIKIMNEVVDITSTLASYPEIDPKFKEDSLKLEKLRAGRLYLFSDDTLNEKVGNFFADFNSFNADPPGVTQAQLKSESADISFYCKNKIIDLTKLGYEK